MNKVSLILRHEVFSLLSRFSYWFGVIGVPLIAFVVIEVVGMVNQSQTAGSTASGPGQAVGSGIGALFSGKPEAPELPQGYVDHAGLIHAFPNGFPKTDLVAYPDDAAAQSALDARKIGKYYVIPADYVQTGKLLAFTLQFNLIDTTDHSGDMQDLINYNLLGGSQALYSAFQEPIKTVEKVNLAPKAESGPVRDKNSQWAFFLPYGMMMLSFIAIMGSSTLLLSSMTKEKENRVLEILMVTAEPRQFLMGKIIGLGLVGLLQVVIWGVSALLLMRLGGQTIALPSEFQLEPSIIVWAVVFFVLGYLVYASLMAGIGALVPSLREASQVTTLVTMPMFIPMFTISALIEIPNSALAVGLSLFPLTAPTTMMLRLAATSVPLWQLLLSAALLLATGLLVIRAVAGIFRSQNLLSGQPLNIKRFALALMGKI